MQRFKELSGKKFSQPFGISLIVVAVAILGICFLSFSHAQSPYADKQAASGTTGGQAAIQSDPTASQQQAVMFGGACMLPNWPVNDGQAVGSFWNCSSPYRTPIGSNPQIDPSSATVINALAAQNNTQCNNQLQPCGDLLAGDESYSMSMYYSTAADPSYTVEFCNQYPAPSTAAVPFCNPPTNAGWGPNPFDKTVTATKGTGQCNPLHIPNGVVLPSGTDKWLYIIDNTKPGLVCAMWVSNYDSTRNQWSAYYGGEGDLFGSTGLPLAGAGTGSNLMGGQILISEVAQGVIPHALQFSVTCNKPGVHRAPANKSDGSCTGNPPGGIQLEEGMHFQLDPSKVDCNSMSSFPLEKMICVALETYGAYDGDNGGSAGPLFQNVAQDNTGVYAKAGLTPAEYQRFPDLPLSDFRLLAH